MNSADAAGSGAFDANRRARQALFPDSVGFAELWGQGSETQLWAEERRHVSAAAPGRQREFAAGRTCARRAMSMLGLDAAPLLALPNRVPAWPNGVVGCISHTRDYCVAAVARRHHIKGLGLDAERVDRMEPELWPMICTPAELEWVRATKPAQTAATLIFSAKEALFKCQFPLLGRWLEFQDVAVSIGQAVFWAQFSANAEVIRLKGRYWVGDGLALTGIVWPETGWDDAQQT